jgi:hypothetical protein
MPRIHIKKRVSKPRGFMKAGARRMGERYKVQGTRYKVQGTRYKVQGSRYKVQGSRCKAHGGRHNDGVQKN